MEATLTPLAGPPEHDVLGLGEDATVGFLVERRRRQEQAAAEELRGVAHWADLHRAEGFVPLALRAVTAEVARLQSSQASGSVVGAEGALRLAGEGAFWVDEFSVCELAAALGLSEGAARRLVGEALELRDRLPRLWARVMAGEVAAWKARRVAGETIPLNAAAADYVDVHLAPFADRLSFGRVLRAVEAAVLRHDEDLARVREARAAEKRGVWLDDCLDGTTQITAVTGTPEARAFDQALDEVATVLGRLGDDESREVRRAKAVGVLADPQYALTLTTPDGDAGQARSDKTMLQVHLHTDALADTASVGASGVVRVEGLGPRSVATFQRWLSDLAPGAQVHVTPVVDLTERISVNAYEAPDRLRAQVAERDDCCQFPWCGRTGRFDLDHIDPYLPPDRGGPPGQTRSENLARLCRFHHRVKTHGGWQSHRAGDGVLCWTSPLGRRYTVDEHGTLPQL